MKTGRKVHQADLVRSFQGGSLIKYNCHLKHRKSPNGEVSTVDSQGGLGRLTRVDTFCSSHKVSFSRDGSYVVLETLL